MYHVYHECKDTITFGSCTYHEDLSSYHDMSFTVELVSDQMWGFIFTQHYLVRYRVNCKHWNTEIILDYSFPVHLVVRNQNTSPLPPPPPRHPWYWCPDVTWRLIQWGCQSPGRRCLCSAAPDWPGVLFVSENNQENLRITRTNGAKCQTELPWEWVRCNRCTGGAGDTSGGGDSPGLTTSFV